MLFLYRAAAVAALAFVSLAAPASAATILINFSGSTTNTVTQNGTESSGGTSAVTGSVLIDTTRLPENVPSQDFSFDYETFDAPFLTTTLTFTGGTPPAFGGDLAVTNILRGMFGDMGRYEIHDMRNAYVDANGSIQSSELALNFTGPVTSQTIDGVLLPVFATGQTLVFSALSDTLFLDASGAPTGDRGVNAQGTVRIDAVTVNATAAVPEPATWATMLLGFGLVGAGLRRRRAAPALA